MSEMNGYIEFFEGKDPGGGGGCRKNAATAGNATDTIMTAFHSEPNNELMEKGYQFTVKTIFDEDCPYYEAI